MYTFHQEKQWGRPCAELPSFIIMRMSGLYFSSWMGRRLRKEYENMQKGTQAGR